MINLIPSLSAFTSSPLPLLHPQSRSPGSLLPFITLIILIEVILAYYYYLQYYCGKNYYLFITFILYENSFSQFDFLNNLSQFFYEMYWIIKTESKTYYNQIQKIINYYNYYSKLDFISEQCINFLKYYFNLLIPCYFFINLFFFMNDKQLHFMVSSPHDLQHFFHFLIKNAFIFGQSNVFLINCMILMQNFHCFLY